MFVVAAAYGGWKVYQVRQFQAESQHVEYNLPPLENFELEATGGAPFRSADMRGEVWVTNFFFSTCPGTCTRLSANIRQLALDEELKDVQFLSISVDPVTDTLPVLEKYAERHDATPDKWRFARGEMDYLKRVGQDLLKLPVIYKDHNDYAAVIDRTGKIRGHYNALSSRECDRLRQKLIELLAEPAPTQEPAGSGENAAPEIEDRAEQESTTEDQAA